MSNSYEFSVVFHDFTQRNIAALIQRFGFPKKTIEIGAFEGHTTFNLVDLAAFNDIEYKHYAIDPFDIGHDLPDKVVAEAFERFTHNLEVCENKDSIEFMRKLSWDGLTELLARGEKADFIYIDGDHRATTVLEDLVLSFRLLNVGGIMLCDDALSWAHRDKNGTKDPQQSPKMAIDSFIHCNWEKIEVIDLPAGYQVAIQKIKE